MRYILIIILLSITGCSEKKLVEINLIRFVMECKKVADKLKVEFIVEGSDERPECTIGQKDDVYGGLSGFYFRSLDELQGAFSAIKLQEKIHLHDKLQACSRKCKDIQQAGKSIYCHRSCHEKAGYRWE